jgi:branched-chain amino acid transport system ATP-binding protein
LASTPALEVRDLTVRRGPLQVVHGVSFDVPTGSVVGLLGLNGAGKSSLLACIAGSLAGSGGTVAVGGEDVTRRPSWERCKRGIVLVPAGRQLFAGQTVLENLLVGGHLRTKAEREETVTRVFDLFPILKEKRDQLGGDLSGGQQQMLAVGRGLMAKPTVLLLDEPSEGLAPLVVEQMFTAISQLREEGDLGILLAEQNAGVVEILDLMMIMHSGAMTDSRPVQASDREGVQQYVFGA